MIEKFIESLSLKVYENKEWLETVEGDDVECISIENLDGILKQLLEEFKN